MKNRRLTLYVPDEEMIKRRKAWKNRNPIPIVGISDSLQNMFNKQSRDVILIRKTFITQERFCRRPKTNFLTGRRFVMPKTDKLSRLKEIIGEAYVIQDPDMLKAYEIDGKKPKVIVSPKTIDEVLMISDQAVASALGGLPPAKIHCSVLAEKAIRLNPFSPTW
jgi:hypothetical protein